MHDATNDRPASISAQMAFARASDVQADAERAGMLRAATHPANADVHEVSELRSCHLTDWSPSNAASLDLDEMGFESIDLSGLGQLQSTLARVRQAGQVTPADASAIRREMKGYTTTLSSGKRLRLLTIAPEGFIMRKAGPNGLKIDPDLKMSEMNNHDGALTVHADQDVHGTPLRQMMRGAAPWIFRHRSPDSANRRSPMLLVNIWIPLQQVSRPLTLMDRRSLDGPRHQLRYALPTDDFLDRDENRRLNDIWMFLHDDAQRWYFNSDMNSSRAYVFDTLGTPHGSVILPGEDVAEHHYLQLQAACEAFRGSDLAALRRATSSVAPQLASDTTAPLRESISRMDALANEVQGAEQDEFLHTDWCERAERAMDRVVRKSIEMRGVAILTPNVWPLNMS
jgi:hypothetical protein